MILAGAILLALGVLLVLGSLGPIPDTRAQTLYFLGGISMVLTAIILGVLRFLI